MQVPQQTPREVEIAQVLVEVVSAATRLTRVAAKAAGGTESPAVWRTLSVLRSSGPMRLGELAEESRVSQPTMTKLIRNLADAEWVRRIADRDDARAWQIAITSKGEAALEEWRERLGTAMLPLFTDLDRGQVDALATAAATINAHVAGRIAPRADVDDEASAPDAAARR
ncbi:MarR family winged helix-turn-helix transcriptional regulator [Agromyces sp. SYSU T00194]|uniref:MarR family winged helix-turn-helix transcriptional regulator n=1 Tax=Agromyces chitinivorans TaxID=3158560 RepID=UPI003396BBD3